jgi:hypothetical protein
VPTVPETPFNKNNGCHKDSDDPNGHNKRGDFTCQDTLSLDKNIGRKQPNLINNNFTTGDKIINFQTNKT